MPMPTQVLHPPTPKPCRSGKAESTPAPRAAHALAKRRPRLLEATLDGIWLVLLWRALRPFARLLPGLTLPGGDIYTPRAGLTLTVDVRDQLEAKHAALAAHASQAGGGLRTLAVLLALPRPLARRVLGTEWFHEVF